MGFVIKPGDKEKIMLNTENLHNYKAKNFRHIYIGELKRTTLNKPVEDLDANERDDYASLQHQMLWGKEHGFNLVLTKDTGKVDCWMIRDADMDKLNPIFKQTILEVL